MREVLTKVGGPGIVFSISILLSRLAGFILLPFLTQVLSESDYGIVDFLALTGQLIALVASQGIPSALFRAYAYEAKTDEEKRTVIASASRYLVLSSLVVCGIAAIFSLPISRAVTGAENYQNLFLLVLLTYIFYNVRNVCVAILKADLKPMKYLIVHCGEFLVCVGLNIYLVLVLKLGIAGIIYSNVIGAFLACLLAVIFEPRVLSLAFDRLRLKKMIHFGIPLVPMVIALWLLDYVDRYFFLWLLDDGEAACGLYGRGAQFVTILQGILIMPFMAVWPNIFYELAKKDDGHRDLGVCGSYYAVVACFLAVGLAAVSRPIMHLMTAPDFHSAWVVIPVLSFSVVFFGASKVADVGFLIAGKTRALPVLMGIAVVVNSIVNYFFIPWLGILGAAWSSLIAFGTLVVIAGMSSRRHYKVIFEWVRLGKVLVVTVVCLLVQWVLPVPAGETKPDLILELFERGVVAAVMFPTLILLLRFFRPHEMDHAKRLLGRLSPGGRK